MKKQDKNDLKELAKVTVLSFSTALALMIFSTNYLGPFISNSEFFKPRISLDRICFDNGQVVVNNQKLKPGCWEYSNSKWNYEGEYMGGQLK